MDIDYSHESFKSYDEEFKRIEEERGFETAYIMFRSPGMCGCMGPRDGAPLCNCRMMVAIAEKYGKVVKIENE